MRSHLLRLLVPASAMLLGVGAWWVGEGLRPGGQFGPVPGVLAPPAPMWQGAPAPLRPPADLLQEAYAAQHIGDYQQATDRYQALAGLKDTAPEAADAAFQLGVVTALRGDYTAAAQDFATFRSAYPSHFNASLAQYWQARSLQQAGQSAQALSLYESFALANPVVEDYVRLQRVQLYSTAGDGAAAFTELALIAQAPTSPQVQQQASRLYADGLMESGDYRKAEALYRDLVASATAGSKLTTLAKLAEAQRLAGRTAEQQQTLAQIVRTYPGSASALQALTALRDQAPLLLTPYQIGRTYYFNRQNEKALAEFNRQRDQLPDGPETPYAGYRTALVYERQNRNEDALAELSRVLNTYPTTEGAQDALWEQAHLLSELGRYDASKQAYAEYRRRFPATQRAQDALIEESLTYYKAGDYGQAAATLAASPAALTPNEAGARNQFWQAKALAAAGDKPAAARAYQQAEQRAPGTYYAMRAEALRQATSSPASRPPAALSNTGITTSDESEAQTWLAKWVPDATTALPTAEQRVLGHAYLQRADLLVQMGEWEGAADEYRSLVRAHRTDIPALFVLARLLHQREQHAAGMLAVDYLQDETATPIQFNLPRMLQKVLHPAPYLPEVTRLSAQYGVDPALLYSLMKQESLFDPQVTSSAQAMGLTQVVPSTAQEIAEQLGVAGFTNADLHRPVVSIQFGAYYLARQLTALAQTAVFALAAYNGGAGNALRWMDNNRQIDPDLFVENIDYPETRSYVERVMQNYAFYQLLYQN